MDGREGERGREGSLKGEIGREGSLKGEKGRGVEPGEGGRH